MNENNTNSSRLMITVALCMVVALGWSYFFSPKPKPKAAQTTAAQTQPVDPAAAAAAKPADPSAPSPAAPAGADVSRGTSALKAFPTERVVLEGDRLRAVLTSDGAGLAVLELKGDKYKKTHEGKAVPVGQVDLAVVEAGQRHPLATEVRGADGKVLIPADASYQVVSRDAGKVVFRAEANGLTVTKTVAVDPRTYKLDVKVEVTSAAAFAGQLVVRYDGKSLPEGQGSSGGFFSAKTNVPAQSICEIAGGKPERLAPGNKHPTWEGKNALFAGVDEQYFLAALVPAAGSPADCQIGQDKAGQVTSTLTFPLSVAANGSATKDLTLFAGPKETDVLSSVAAPLRDAVDLGFWWLIARVLLEVMKFFYKVVPPHNWGIAIILLTLSVKAVTFPLQHKSMKSMQEMQRLQPQIDEMKKKFAGDTQRQNLEQMKLFKEHGVNPMGSCLPMLIQMPIWFALYTTLGVSVELYNSVFIHGWINDLTARDPYFILPVAMGVTMILTQVLTPSPMSNPSQKTMGFAMSGFFALLMFTYPAGLTLYIFTNNLLSIAQQVYLRRTFKMNPPPASGQTLAVNAKRA